MLIIRESLARLERFELPAPLLGKHTAISSLVNGEAEPFAVQKLVGHSDVRLTMQTYAHLRAEALRRAIGVLDRIDVGRRTAGGSGS